jgi:hypothetical protein
MERQSVTVRSAVMLLYYWIGFEITVLSTLAVTTAHVLKVSWRQ